MFFKMAELSPQNSALITSKQTENYDSDDSVACGEKFTAITAWFIEKYWKSQSS